MSDISQMKPFNVLCPFHQERTPSCRIWPNGYFFCHGCHERGHVSREDYLLSTYNMQLPKPEKDSSQLVFNFWSANE